MGLKVLASLKMTLTIALVAPNRGGGVVKPFPSHTTEVIRRTRIGFDASPDKKDLEHRSCAVLLRWRAYIIVTC